MGQSAVCFLFVSLMVMGSVPKGRAQYQLVREDPFAQGRGVNTVSNVACLFIQKNLADILLKTSELYILNNLSGARNPVGIGL
jgi:hypothetical protein